MDLMAIRRGIIASQQAGLPSAYQRVEYLESSGTQYIDTGEYFHSNDRCTIAFAPLADNSDTCVFGIYQASDAVIEINMLNGHFRLDLTATTNDYTVGRRYIYAKDGGKWYMDGVESTVEYPNKDCLTHSLLLFARWYNGAATKPSKIKIYEYSHERNGSKLRDLIPCVRKSDSVAGMYDTVTKTFFTNAGTGTFIIPT